MYVEYSHKLHDNENEEDKPLVELILSLDEVSLFYFKALEYFYK